MPIVEYPFIADTSWHPTWRPYLLIEVVSPENGYGIPVFAPIDNGARDCYVPFEWAREMNIICSEENKTIVNCADLEREGYRHSVHIQVFGITPVPPNNVFVPQNVILDLRETEVVFLRDLKTPQVRRERFLGEICLDSELSTKKVLCSCPG